MKLERKPNQWSCLATSFAMAMGITTKRFVEVAGHDGGQIISTKLQDPLCRRGFHVSEAVAVAIHLGFSATPIELFPLIAPADGGPPHIVFYNRINEDGNWTFFATLIHHFRGVLEARTASGNWHAVAFDKGVICDPDGRSYEYSRAACECRELFTTRLWRIEKLPA